MNGGFFMGGFPIVFNILFIVVVGFIIFAVIRSASQWSKNNKSPVLSVAAKLVSKRTAVSHHHHNTGDAHGTMHMSTSTSYYATFEVESGDRMEFRVKAGEYGMLAEGDMGKLTFQGTRYIGFERRK
ncbi:MAG: DUF2500 domain-containing protein [Christensenellales bacterium]